MSNPPPDDEANVADAIRFVEQSAAGGANFVAFPETYPGPWRMPAHFDPVPAMMDVAKRCAVHVQFGTIEPIDTARGTAHNVLCLAYPDGRPVGRYRRTHPPGPWLYRGGTKWDFDYVEASDFPVFETAHGVVGLAMCSEVYVPEVSRALALQGAEIIFLPAGVDKDKLWNTWRNLIWSRAIENLAVVVTTQNLFSPADRGLAMVATPEDVIFECTQPGVFLVDIDLERPRMLRSSDDGIGSQEKNAAKAGLLSQWQRPELYAKMRQAANDVDKRARPVSRP
jgi:predicted amidohydrolase